ILHVQLAAHATEQPKLRVSRRPVRILRVLPQREHGVLVQQSTCPSGQTCNLLVGLCQHSVPCEATDAGNPNNLSCPSGYACDYGTSTQNGACLLTGWAIIFLTDY